MKHLVRTPVRKPARRPRVFAPAMPALKCQELRLGQHRLRNNLLGGKFMVRRQTRDQIFIAELQSRQIADVVRQRDQGKVKVAAAQPRQQLLCLFLAQKQLQLGKGLSHQRHGGRNQIGRDRRDDPERQRPGKLACAARGQIRHVFVGSQDFAGARRHRPA